MWIWRQLKYFYVQIGRLNAGPPFFTYINPHQPIINEQDQEKEKEHSEKYNKMKMKNEKR